MEITEQKDLLINKNEDQQLQEKLNEKMIETDEDNNDISNQQIILTDSDTEQVEYLHIDEVEKVQKEQKHNFVIKEYTRNNEIEILFEDSTREPIKEIRDYQMELFKNCYDKNKIIYLDTGTGKTLVAAMHIYYQMKKNQDNNKKVVFLANTIQLVKQQFQELMERVIQVSNILEENDKQQGEIFRKLGNFDFKVKKNDFICLYGNSNSQEEIDIEDKLNKERWGKIMEECKVIVMVGQLFLNSLRRGYLNLKENVSLIVLDECHHTKDNHAYNLLMKEIYFRELKKNDKKDLPVIMGLTASPVNVNDKDIKNINIQIDLQMYQLCLNLNSNFAKQQIQKKQISEPKLDIEIFDEENYEKIFPELAKMYQEIIPLFSDSNYQKLSPTFKTLMEDIEKICVFKAIEVYLELGKYGFSLYMEEVHYRIQNIEKQKMIYEDDVNHLTQIQKIVETHVFSNGKSFMSNEYRPNQGQKIDIKYLSNKFIKLLDILITRGSTLDNNEKNPNMILIFVKERIIVEYLYKILEYIIRESQWDLPQLKSNYILGSGNALLQKKAFYENDNVQDIKVNEYNKQKEYATNKHKEYSYNKLTEQYQSEQNKDQDFINQIKQKSNKGTIESLMSDQYDLKKQINVIQKFRKKEFPILITTSVVEEGFDIPTCNLVINYNEYYTMQSYIQRKGRARQANSQFIILVSSSKLHKECSKQIDIFTHIIDYSKEKANQELTDINQKDLQLKLKQTLQMQGKPDNTKENDYKYKIISNSKAILNNNWSVEILQNYASQLKKDTDSMIKGPAYFYTRLSEIGYTCSIIMPSSSQIRYMQGEFCNNKEIAKRNAAYRLVIELKKKNFICDDLKPLKSNLYLKEYLLDEEEEEDIIDQKYQDIIKKLVKYVHEESQDKNKELILLQRKHYPTFTQESFYFRFMNPQLRQINLQQPQQFKCQLYVFKFEKISRYNLKNYNIPDVTHEIGMIHCLQQPIQIKNKLLKFTIEKTQLEVRELDTQMQLSFEQYKKLQLVHFYLNAASRNLEIEFFSILTKQKVQPGYLSQENREYKYQFVTNNNLTAISCILKKTKENQYIIDYEIVDKILEFIEYMKTVYLYINPLKNKRKNKDFQNTQSLKPPLEVFQNFEKNYQKEWNDNFILQHITENLFLSKCVLQKCTQLSEDEQKEVSLFQRKKEKDNDSEKLQQQPSQQTSSLFKRKEYLKKMFDYGNNDISTYVLSVSMMKKDMKKKINDILGRTDESITFAENKKSNNFFLNEFIPLPLNYTVYIQSQLVQQFVLPIMGDLFLTQHFIENTYNVKEIQKYQEVQQNIDSLQTYEEKSKKKYVHLTLENCAQICKFLKEPNSEYKHIIKHLETQFNSQASLPDNESYFIKQNQIDCLKNSNQNNNKIDNLLNSIEIQEVQQSLTSKMYNSNQNYEQMEFVGDTILKLLASVQVFLENPQYDEGCMHIARAAIVRNSFLKRTAVKNNFFYYIFTDKIFKKMPPPVGFEDKNYQEDLQNRQFQYYHDNFYHQNDQPEELVKSNYDKYISDKMQADVVEALIGTVYNHHQNLESCQQFLYTLDILKYPHLNFKKNPSIDFEIRQNLKDQGNIMILICEQIERKIGYKFNNLSYLFQAMTQNSFKNIIDSYLAEKNQDNKKFLNQAKKLYDNLQYNKQNQEDFVIEGNSQLVLDKFNDETHIMKCLEFDYQRLEFIGDAVIDFIVMILLREIYPEQGPGQLSLLKQSVVSNKALAIVSLELDLDSLIMMEYEESYKIVKDLKAKTAQIKQNINCIEQRQLQVIKVLGDIFESLVGAMFCDCGFDISKIQKILIDILKPYVNHFTSPDQQLKLPQNQLYQFLVDLQKIDEGDVIKLKTEMKNSQQYFYILDKNGIKISETYVLSDNEKEAYDKIYEKLQGLKKASQMKK